MIKLDRDVVPLKKGKLQQVIFKAIGMVHGQVEMRNGKSKGGELE